MVSMILARQPHLVTMSSTALKRGLQGVSSRHNPGSHGVSHKPSFHPILSLRNSSEALRKVLYIKNLRPTRMQGHVQRSISRRKAYKMDTVLSEPLVEILELSSRFRKLVSHLRLVIGQQLERIR